MNVVFSSRSKYSPHKIGLSSIDDSIFSQFNICLFSGNCRASLFDEDHVFWIIPFYEKSYALRTWPVRKRLVQELVTKDNKVVEVCSSAIKSTMVYIFCSPQIVIHLRLRVKVCWAQDIVTRMGTDFSRTFLEQEVSLDAETVVSEHTYDVCI